MTKHDDTELYRLLVAGNVIGFNRVVSSRQVDVVQLRCASEKNTVLHIACTSKLMVVGNSQGDLPIHTAIKSRKLNVVDALTSCLQQQQAVHQTVLEWCNLKGNTALHIALEEHDDDDGDKVAKELVDLYPIASYFMNIEGICPLYMAIKKELDHVVHHMLQKLQQQPSKEDALQCLTKGQSVLHAAVIAQKTDMLEDLLSFDDGKLINIIDNEGRTALSYAAIKGYLDKVLIFHERVVHSALISNKDKSFPIHQAVIGGHINIIRILTSSMFLVDGRGQNIVHLAATKGDPTLVSHLISLSNVDSLLNQTDNDGNTPLHLATLAKQVEIVEILIQNEGVNVGLSNKEGLMATDLAKKLGFENDADKIVVQRIDLMLERATKDIKLFPIDGKLYQLLVNQEINQVSEIISSRKIRIKDLLTLEEGNNVLHIAACLGNTQLIHDLLVGYNCTTLMYQANKNGDLPIHSAIKVGKLQSLKALFQWSEISADRICEWPVSDGNTALHLAMLYNHREIANYLYNQCPQAAYCLNKTKICPLFLAIKYWSTSEKILINNMIQGLKDNVELQNKLKEAESVVHVAILIKDRAAIILKSIINTIPSLLDSHDNKGLSPLSYAALNGQVKGVKLILKTCPDLEFKRDKDTDGSFPIHQAVKGGNANVVILFKPLRLLNNKGQNVLHVAADLSDKYNLFFASSLGVPRLLKFKELINTADDNGNTPLHLAVKGFHLRVVHYLLRYQHIVNGNL